MSNDTAALCGVRTGDILLENVKLLQDGAEDLLRVLVDDEDLPFVCARLNGAYGLEEFCVAQSAGAGGPGRCARTISERRDERSHRGLYLDWVVAR